MDSGPEWAKLGMMIVEVLVWPQGTEGWVSSSRRVEEHSKYNIHTGTRQDRLVYCQMLESVQQVYFLKSVLLDIFMEYSRQVLENTNMKR